MKKTLLPPLLIYLACRIITLGSAFRTSWKIKNIIFSTPSLIYSRFSSLGARSSSCITGKASNKWLNVCTLWMSVDGSMFLTYWKSTSVINISLNQKIIFLLDLVSQTSRINMYLFIILWRFFWSFFVSVVH